MSFDFEVFSPHGDDALLERLAGIKHVALDMDGTIYMGTTLFKYTKPFLGKLRSLGIFYSFLTNNPSKSVSDYLSKLEGMGVTATEDEIYTSSLATIDYLRTNYPGVTRLFMLGTPSMVAEFEKAGFEAVRDDASDEPEALVVGFDMTLSYQRLCMASWWARQGKPYIATNPDKVCPTDQPTVLVDCGAICKCIEWATGRKPDMVLGKPDKNMLGGITSRLGIRPEEVAMVGDRIYTDIEMARNAGAFGVLVLSGETTMDMVERAERLPDVTLGHIGHLAELLENCKSK